MRRRGATLAEIETAYRDGLPRFRRVAAAIVGEEEEALDAVQDAFGRAIRHRRSFARRGRLEAWLWRLVVNAARDARARVVSDVFDAAAEHAVPITGANGSGSTDAYVAQAVALLPERQRLAVFLRYYADLDYAAIAAVLEIAPGTVAATLSVAHRTLRQTLEEVVR
jgi:RNA polymerase sigma factor (sigma-70 family)